MAFYDDWKTRTPDDDPEGEQWAEDHVELIEEDGSDVLPEVFEMPDPSDDDVDEEC